jgi:hypothetical protein
MRRTLALLAACILVLPAEARPEGDEPPEWSWGDEAAAPPAESGGDQASVDVSVGIGTPGASVGFSTFRDGLAPYGEWVRVASYGDVWRPAGVAAGWRPYYYGRWEWTDEGWLWVSDEAFGWATYHYGRWAYDSYYGWVWVPGYQWAPAWVTWRYSPDYVGWAPLAPGFSVYVSAFPVVHSWWTFVPCGSFAGSPIYRHAYAPAFVPRIWAATRPAPPRAVAFGHPSPAWGGPARGFVESRIGRPIAPVRVQPVGSPGAVRAPARAGVVPVFRPEARPRPAPALSPPQRGTAYAGPGGARPWPRTEPSPGWASPSGRQVAPGPAPSTRARPEVVPPGARPQVVPPGAQPQVAPPQRSPQPPRAQAPAARNAPPAAPHRVQPAPSGGSHPAPSPSRPAGGREREHR